MIQRPWDGSFDEYLTYTLRDQTAERASTTSSELKYTDAGRKVYGGGGIEPDKFVVGSCRSRGLHPTRFGTLLQTRGRSSSNFADQFTAEGDTRLSAANKNKKPIARGFAVTDDDGERLQGAARRAEGQDRRGGVRRRTTPFIRAMIHFEIDSALFGMDEARKNLIAKDPQAQFALGQFGEAEHLIELASTRVDARRKASSNGSRSRAFGPIFCGRTLLLPLGMGAC